MSCCSCTSRQGGAVQRAPIVPRQPRCLQVAEQAVQLFELETFQLLNSSSDYLNADACFRLDAFELGQQLGALADVAKPAAGNVKQQHEPSVAQTKPHRPRADPARAEPDIERPSRLLEPRQPQRNPYAIGQGRLSVGAAQSLLPKPPVAPILSFLTLSVPQET